MKEKYKLILMSRRFVRWVFAVLLTITLSVTSDFSCLSVTIAKADSYDRLVEARWNFDNISEWSDSAYVDGNYVQLIVGLRQEKTECSQELASIVNKHDGKMLDQLSLGGRIIAVTVGIPLENVSFFASDIKERGWVRYVEPNIKFQTNLVPNDPYWNEQWGSRKIGADKAWNTTLGDPSVLVAVIDTGIDWDHPDLVANYVPLGYDWVNNDTNPMDDDGHGTHVAGIIAATFNNSIGVAGVAQVGIMAEKVADQYGRCSAERIASGIIHAADQGADIINMSFGGYNNSDTIHDAIKYANNSGVLLVAAAGNFMRDDEFYPAAYGEVIAVSATDAMDDPAVWDYDQSSGTNYGEWIDLAAPGTHIYSTWWNDAYKYLSGTSMASPYVAGVAALVWSRYPTLTPEQVKKHLQYTAYDAGSPGFDYFLGCGRVNASSAVELPPYQHELCVALDCYPSGNSPGCPMTLNATVSNFGRSNESNVQIFLLINGSIVNSENIEVLPSLSSYTLNHVWTPTVEGVYNITAYVPVVPEEEILNNNVCVKLVQVVPSTGGGGGGRDDLIEGVTAIFHKRQPDSIKRWLHAKQF